MRAGSRAPSVKWRAVLRTARAHGKSRRLGHFHELMRERGATRPFAGKIESWSYAPINDTEVVASHIRRALGLETKA